MAHEWPLWRSLRLRALADSPDAFGSTLAEEQDRSQDVWAARLQAATQSGKDCPLVAELGGQAIGLIWAKCDGAEPPVVHLYQVWVAPEGRAHGAGGMLLSAAIAWARSLGAAAVELGVTCGDTPAYRLYLRAGLVAVGAPAQRRPDSPLMEQAMRLPLLPAQAQAAD
jgi:GNAT superfamily N-acetyltransferase